MADLNYKSYEHLEEDDVAVGVLNPYTDGWTKWADTMKTFKCNWCVFFDGIITGGREDCIDVGTHTNDCSFDGIEVSAENSRYIITLKSHSERNTFQNFYVLSHAKRCDIQHGNWSDSDNGSNANNVYDSWTSAERKPITYSYRFFSNSKPIFYNMETKHLWWLSAGITVYFWGKWLWKKVRR